MKATHVLLLTLLIALAACSAPARSAAVPPDSAPAGQPIAAQVSLAPTTSAPAATVLAAVGPTQPVQRASASPTALPAAPRRAEANVPAFQPAPFNIGVPAGDAYYPYSVAVDSAKDLAYVYHADSAENRPVISVVDLEAGEVTRLIRLDQTVPGASGRLFLTPDGKRLFLQENLDSAVLVIDTGTGSVRKVLDGTRDAVLSDDGRVLYALHGESVAAYSPADLMLGRSEPIWRVSGRFGRLALNGQRLLAATYERAGALNVLDADTGKLVSQGDSPDSADVIAAGPDGGWALVTSGQAPRLVRYDAALKSLGETPIMYTGDLTYDPTRNRYLLGGYRYSEQEAAGRQVVLSVDARDGRLLDEERWDGTNPPTVFAPWGQDRLLALPAGGPANLAVLDGASLALESSVPTGVRVVDLVLDDAGQKLYVADDLGRIHLLQLPEGEELAVWEGRSPVALDTATGRLYANRGSGVVALDARTGALQATFPQRGHPAPDPKADLVYIANNGVTMYDRSGKKLGALPSTFPVERGFVPNPYAYAAQVNPVTGHVAVAMHNGVPGSNGGSYLRIYPRQSDNAIEPPAPHSFVQDLTTDSQGNWFVAYSPARTEEAVQVLTPDGREVDRLDHRWGYLGLDEEEDDLYLFVDGRVTRLAASTLTPTDVYGGPGYVAKMEFSPTTRTGYVVQSSGPLVTPVLVDALTAPDLRPVPGRPAPEAYNDGVAAVAQGRQRLVLGRLGENYRTTDGAKWERLLPGLGMGFSYATLVAPRTIFVTGRSTAGGEGVWRSTDGGDTWEWLGAGLTDLQPLTAVLANSANDAYFLTRGQGLVRWDSALGKWQTASPVRRDDQQWWPVLAPDGSLFRSYAGNLERSSDRGVSWIALGAAEKTGSIIGFSTLYTVTHTLFSVVRSGYEITGIQRSTDKGKTWQLSLSGPPLGFDGYTPEVSTGFGNTYLLLRPYNGDPSLLRTTDLGVTWEQAPKDVSLGIDHVAVDPLDGRLWLGVKGGVRTLDPDKVIWTKLSPPQTAGTAAPARVTATATATPCSRALTGGDAEVNARNLGLGCPRGITQSIPMARQRFQNGQMIWRQDRKQIYVLYNDGRWNVYDDKWQEGDPADDPAIVAPSGLQQPGRGFGKVWREQLGGPKAALGWALEKEQGVEGMANDWDQGVVLRFGGEVIALLVGGAWR